MQNENIPKIKIRERLLIDYGASDKQLEVWKKFCEKHGATANDEVECSVDIIPMSLLSTLVCILTFEKDARDLMWERLKITNSKFIFKSSHITDSYLVTQSNRVYDSKNVDLSSEITNCEKVTRSSFVKGSFAISDSKNIVTSNNLYFCSNCTNTEFLVGCDNIRNSSFSVGCSDIANALFCLNIKSCEEGKYYLFNQELHGYTQEDFNRLYEEAYLILEDGGLVYDKPVTNPLLGLREVVGANTIWEDLEFTLPFYDKKILYQIFLCSEILN